MNTIQYIKNWVFSKNSFSFFLPDGAIGRPFDNQYYIDSIIKSQDGLVVKLSGGVEFEFKGEINFRDEVCNLIFTDFSKLIYKIDGSIEKEYLEGEFCLNGF